MSRPPVKRKRAAPKERNPETRVEREVIYLMRLHGGKVKKFSQGIRGKRDANGKWNSQGGTRQTRGVSDLEVFFPGVLVKFEVKTPDGEKEHHRMLKLRPEEVTAAKRPKWEKAQAQHEYQMDCFTAGVPYARGGVAEAVALLTGLGLYKGETHE